MAPSCIGCVEDTAGRGRRAPLALAVLAAAALPAHSTLDAAKASQFCPDQLHGIFADMHDGDRKEVMISGTSLTIKPSGNNQTWTISATLDPQSCSASVDFNVEGKPGAPPVALRATFWTSISQVDRKTEVEFTDPSGTVAGPTAPLNLWVELKDSYKQVVSWSCPTSWQAVYTDMHDGDQKEIRISGTSVIIRPYGNTQDWEVRSQIDINSCSALVDFRVPGKPSPPPVNLRATLMYLVSAAANKTELELTDETGTLAAASIPLNTWVQVSEETAAPPLV